LVCTGFLNLVFGSGQYALLIREELSLCVFVPYFNLEMRRQFV
jgi:hypothetical protein